MAPATAAPQNLVGMAGYRTGFPPLVGDEPDVADSPLDLSKIKRQRDRLSAPYRHGWRAVLTGAFRRAAARGVAFDPFTVDQVVALTGADFFGADSIILSGLGSPEHPVRQALRVVGDLSEAAETRTSLEVSS